MTSAEDGCFPSISFMHMIFLLFFLEWSETIRRNPMEFGIAWGILNYVKAHGYKIIEKLLLMVSVGDGCLRFISFMQMVFLFVSFCFFFHKIFDLEMVGGIWCKVYFENRHAIVKIGRHLEWLKIKFVRTLLNLKYHEEF